MNDSSDFVVYAHPELQTAFVGGFDGALAVDIASLSRHQWEDSTRFDALQQFRDVAGADRQVRHAGPRRCPGCRRGACLTRLGS